MHYIFRLLLAGLAGSASSTSVLALTPQQKDLENYTNKVRSETGVPAANMRRVTYNPELQTAMNDFIKENSGYWFNIPGNRYELMNQPGFETFANEGYQYLFHDTCGNGMPAVLGIFKFRGQKQKKCFRYENCSPTEYDGYSTCYNPLAEGNCNWWFQYYPELVDAKLSVFACSLLGVPGINNFHHQPNSFVCYGLKLDSKGNPDLDIPTNDQPFVEGPRCSKCPADAKYCYHNALCDDSSASPTTTKPTPKPTTLKPTKAITYKPSARMPSKGPTRKHSGRILNSFDRHVERKNNIMQISNEDSLAENKRHRSSRPKRQAV